MRALVAHEPPVFDVLPQRVHWQHVIKEVEETFAAAGTWPALGGFGVPGFGTRLHEVLNRA